MSKRIQIKQKINICALLYLLLKSCFNLFPSLYWIKYIWLNFIFFQPMIYVCLNAISTICYLPLFISSFFPISCYNYTLICRWSTNCNITRWNQLRIAHITHSLVIIISLCQNFSYEKSNRPRIFNGLFNAFPNALLLCSSVINRNAIPTVYSHSC